MRTVCVISVKLLCNFIETKLSYGWTPVNILQICNTFFLEECLSWTASYFCKLKIRFFRQLSEVICWSSRSQMFFKIGVLKKVFKFHRKAPVLRSLFDKVAGFEACNSIKKRLQQRCFLVKFVKFLSTPFFKEHWWLLLVIKKCPRIYLKIAFLP